MQRNDAYCIRGSLILYSDIKPENLLFYPTPFIPTKHPKPHGPEDEDKVDEGEFVLGVGAGGIGQIKIADFGLSKVVWDSVTQTPCGTVGYTAPEIVKDERYSKSVDMWALGCVLYTLLCGFPPFYDESIQVLTEKVARGQYTFLSPWWDEISKPAQDLVSHLLTVDPDKRYTIRQFLDHPWIRNTREPTYAAADAPPLATPLYTRHAQTPGDPMSAYLETPGGGRTRADFRSPGAINLREVFDVGYAVHRQEEETKRRARYGANAGGFGAVALNEIDEDEDEDEEEDGDRRGMFMATISTCHSNNPRICSPSSNSSYVRMLILRSPPQPDVNNLDTRMRNTSLDPTSAPPPQSQQQQRGYGQHSAAVAAAAKQQVKRQKGPFELSLDNATLLGRRGKGTGVPVGAQGGSRLREEVVG